MDTQELNTVIERLLSSAKVLEVPMSRESARALSRSVGPGSARDCDRAVAMISAFCDDGRLDVVPMEFWRRDSDDAIDITGLLVSYVIEGMRPGAREVLWWVALLSERFDQELCLALTQQRPEELEAHISELAQRGCVITSNATSAPQLSAPVARWVKERSSWDTEPVRELVLTHAALLCDEFELHRLTHAIYNSAADPDLVRALDARAVELSNALARLEHIDINRWGHLALALLVHELQSRTRPPHRDAIIAQLEARGHSIESHELVTHLLLALVTLTVEGPTSLQRARTWLALAKARAEQLDVGTRAGQTARVCVAIKHAWCNERLGEPLGEHLEALDSWYVRLERDLDLSTEIQITLLRQLARLDFELARNERGEALIKQALELAHLTRDPGLISLTTLELAECCSRTGRDDEFEAHCETILEICPTDCFPNILNYVRFALGYLSFGRGDTLRSRALCESASRSFMDGGDMNTYRYIQLILIALDMGDGHDASARERLESVRSVFEHGGSAAQSPYLLQFTLCAIPYAMLEDQFMVEQVILNARTCHELTSTSGIMTWMVDHLTATVDVIRALQTPAGAVSLREQADLLDALRAQRAEPGDDVLSREGMLYMRQGYDRLVDLWLARHGVSAEHPVQVRVDAPRPTWFAINHLPRVSLARRAAMRRILSALIEQSRAVEGEPLSVERLFEIGWPGELASHDSIQARVYNTISRMRRLGLDTLIEHDGDGYRWGKIDALIIDDSSCSSGD